MENKKLLKFLQKDITEIEELFADKGSKGFDAYEIEFLQSRFKGAKQIIQILEDKENKNLEDTLEIESKSLEAEKETLDPPKKAEEIEKAPNIIEEKEVEAAVQEESKELEHPDIQEVIGEIDEVNQGPESRKDDDEFVPNKEILKKEPEAEPEVEVSKDISSANEQDDMELDDEQEETVGRTLGDSFLKERSVNDLMNNGSSKLENKLSNSPVISIQGAIGINDRYQYIRELFNGDAETFVNTVTELDKFNTIQEAVSYLQQNYKWKKNETSLKFVNLVKRRFPNG